MDMEDGFDEADVYWRDKPVRDRLGFALIHDTVYTDIVFVVGRDEVRIPAHKLILRLSSLVFEDLISNHEEQGLNEIQLPNVDPLMFKRLLKFIYTDELEMYGFLTFIRIAKDFGFHRLQEQTQKVLMKTNITFENAVLMLDIAKGSSDPLLEQRILEFIRRNATNVMEAKSLVQISYSGLCQLLLDDELYADEFCVFKAAVKWATFRCKKKGLPISGENIRDILKDARLYVRYKLMSYAQLVSDVKSSEILTASEYLLVLKSYVDPTDNPLGIPSNKRVPPVELAPENNGLHVHNALVPLSFNFNSVQQPLQEMVQAQLELVEKQASLNTLVPATDNAGSELFQLQNCSIDLRDILNAVQLQFLVRKIVLHNVNIHSSLAARGRRVYLPNLESFHFFQDKDLSATLPDKTFMDGLTIKEFLFFEKHKNKSWCFSNIWTLGVEIRICVKGITIMELDPKKEKLTLAFHIKEDVDAIFRNLRRPHSLTSLCLTACEITGADNISTNSLETLVIQGVTFQGDGDSKVKTLINKCHRLKNLSIYIPTGMKVNFGSDFKTKSKETLERLALAKADISGRAKMKLTSFEPFLCLTELYLDVCIWTNGFADSFKYLFPKLKSLAVRSVDTCRPNRLLHEALDIQSLEQIAIFRYPGTDTFANPIPNLNLFVPPASPRKAEMVKFLTSSGLTFPNDEVPNFILVKDVSTGQWKAGVDLVQLDEIHFYQSMLNEFFIDSSVSKLIT